MNFKSTFAILTLVTTLVSSFAWGTPECKKQSNDFQPNNLNVIAWKTSTKNLFKSRAFIVGIVKQFYSKKDTHTHFSIQIGQDSQQTIEVIYNNEFGPLPRIEVGMQIKACGDYITSNEATERYRQSPDKAIIHWVHKSPDLHRHEDGFLEIDGKVYGGL